MGAHSLRRPCSASISVRNCAGSTNGANRADLAWCFGKTIDCWCLCRFFLRDTILPLRVSKASHCVFRHRTVSTGRSFTFPNWNTHRQCACLSPPCLSQLRGTIIEAWDDGSTLHPRSDISPNSRRRVLRLTAAGAVAGELDDDADDADDPDDAEAPFDFNPETGALEDGPGDGVLSLEPAIMREDREERRAYVRKCISCGQTGGRFGPGYVNSSW